MKLALSLVVWTLIALAALFALGPDTSRDLPKPKSPPSHPAQHASVPSMGLLAPALAAGTKRTAAVSAFSTV